MMLSAEAELHWLDQCDHTSATPYQADAARPVAIGDEGWSSGARGPSRMTLVLRAAGVHRVFDEGAGRIVALKGVDLAVQARQIIALVGPPGSGKSTLVRAIGGLDRNWTGSIRLLCPARSS